MDVQIDVLPQGTSPVVAGAWREAHKNMSFALSKSGEWERYSKMPGLRAEEVNHALERVSYLTARAARIKRALSEFHTKGVDFATPEIMWV